MDFEYKKPLNEWKETNIPKDNLIYKSGLSHQIEELLMLGMTLNSIPYVVGKHYSKSVRLPVTYFKVEQENRILEILIRDNFYNIKAVFLSNKPIKLSLEDLYPEKDNTWLENEINRYCNYTKNPVPTDDSWYEEKWSSGSILREDNRIFIADSICSCYCEGINSLNQLSKGVYSHYKTETKGFTISLSSYSEILKIVNRIKYYDKN